MPARFRPWSAAPAGWLLLAAVLALTTVAFGRFTTVGFAGTDSLTLVQTSRLLGPADVVHLATSPVMDRTSFAQGELVYRPFVSFTFALDAALWDANAVGFHLTNLAIHLATTAAVWALLRGLGLSRTASLVGSLLFALHPVAVATVPVIARRDSLIPVAAFTASMALLVRQVRADRPSRPSQVAALVLFGIALFSKESAFAAFLIVPAVAYAGCRLAPCEDRGCLAATVRAVVPYAVLVGFALVVRLVVLGTLGGYQGVPIATPDARAYRAALASFARFLLWPIGQPWPVGNVAWVALLTLALGLVLGLGTALPGRYARPLAVGCWWVVVFAVFHAAVKTLSGAWLLYFPLVGTALIAGAVVDGVRVVWLHPRPATALAGAGLAGIVALWTLAVLRASPLFEHYDDWQVAGGISTRYLDASVGCMQDAATGATLTLVDVPSALDRPGSQTDLLAPTLVSDYTVQADLALAYPDRGYTVRSTSSIVVPGAALSLQCDGPPAARDLVTARVPA